jgi:exosortase/archaeosortase
VFWVNQLQHQVNSTQLVNFVVKFELKDSCLLVSAQMISVWLDPAYSRSTSFSLGLSALFFVFLFGAQRSTFNHEHCWHPVIFSLETQL